MSKRFSRRDFLQVSSSAAAASAIPFSAWPTPVAQAATRGPFKGTLCFFSKPVPQLNWGELARAAKDAGFGGIDLTVRPEGHVLPERAAVDLPKAVAAIRAEGMEVPMISTALLSAHEPNADDILRTAGKLSIQYVKPGYYHYKLVNVVAELEQAGQQFRSLVELAASHGVQVGYHNHDGYIGAAVWDMARVIDPMDPRRCGFYFDLCHATVDGGENGGLVSGNMVLPRLKMLAVKDCTWIKLGPHKWRGTACPMGEGMVSWKEFLPMLAQTNFHGPVSLQQEFPIDGVADYQGRAISRATVPQVMASAKKNLDYLKLLLRASYETA